MSFLGVLCYVCWYSVEYKWNLAVIVAMLIVLWTVCKQVLWRHISLCGRMRSLHKNTAKKITRSLEYWRTRIDVKWYMLHLHIYMVNTHVMWNLNNESASFTSITSEGTKHIIITFLFLWVQTPHLFMIVKCVTLSVVFKTINTLLHTNWSCDKVLSSKIWNMIH